MRVRFISWRGAAIAAVLLVAVCIGGSLYVRWMDEVWHLRWLKYRSDSLGTLGARIAKFTALRSGLPPQDFNELIDAGVVAETEIDSECPWSDTHVSRRLRPIPSRNMPGDLIMIIESYDPPTGRRVNCLVLRLDGTIQAEVLTKAIAADNELRHNNGLSAVEGIGVGVARAGLGE